MNKSIDVIIPAYNEGKAIFNNILKIHEQLAADSIPHRFIIVNDGSADDTWAEITRLEKELPELCALCLSRNFGKEAAICAGLEQVTADACIVMDSDLQHPPHMILKMVEKRNEGYDIVECVKTSRGKESLLSKLLAKSFYALFKKLSGFDFNNSSDFKLIDKKVIDAWKEMGDTNVFFRGMMEWVGFKKCRIAFDVDSRSGGVSKFSRTKLLSLALHAILSFSSKPLLLTCVVGIVFFVAAFFLTAQTVYNKFSGAAVSGFTTVIILLLIVGSLILFCMAIIGMYIARIFEEVKGRPRYIVMHKLDKRKE